MVNLDLHKINNTFDAVLELQQCDNFRWFHDRVGVEKDGSVFACEGPCIQGRVHIGRETSFENLTHLMSKVAKLKVDAGEEKIRKEIFGKFSIFTQHFEQAHRDEIQRVENSPKNGIKGLFWRIINRLSGATEVKRIYDWSKRVLTDTASETQKAESKHETKTQSTSTRNDIIAKYKKQVSFKQYNPLDPLKIIDRIEIAS